MNSPNISKDWTAQTNRLEVRIAGRYNSIEGASDIRAIAYLHTPCNEIGSSNINEIEEEARANRKLIEAAPALLEELAKAYLRTENEEHRKSMREALKKAGVTHF